MQLQFTLSQSLIKFINVPSPLKLNKLSSLLLYPGSECILLWNLLTLEQNPRCFANDLKGPATVTIKEITQEERHPAGRPVKKFVLWFTETPPRGVIPTRPLGLQLTEILGDDTASWKGQKITLYPAPMNVAGRCCVAVRARSVL